MTVMRWADARGLIGHTGTGWNRHDCRRIWLVASVSRQGDIVFLTPPGEADWLEIEDPILAFDRASEASEVASYQDTPWAQWYPINLSDLLAFEGGGVRSRYRTSEPFLRELAQAWAEMRARDE